MYLDYEVLIRLPPSVTFRRFSIVLIHDKLQSVQRTSKRNNDVKELKNLFYIFECIIKNISV